MATDRVSEIFADARALYSDALEMLEQSKTRNAAEKAWWATKRATDALLLARTGVEPRTSGKTAEGLRRLQGGDPDAMFGLRQRYLARQAELHGNCFYDGNCEPVAQVERDIRETVQYIQDAERLAAG